MTSIAHALVAGAIASRFPDPASAATLAFISHFIMDTVPHWDIGTNWRKRSKSTTGLFAIAETLFGITIAFLLFGPSAPILTLTLAIAASLLPDWLETPWYIFFVTHNKQTPGKRAKFFEKLTYYIYKMENVFHAKAQFPMGLITQIVTVGFFLILLR